MKLSDVTLPTVSGNTSGTLAWNEADTVLNIGTASYDVVFTPTDTTNYNTKTGSISVKVEVYAEYPVLVNLSVTTLFVKSTPVRSKPSARFFSSLSL